MVGRSEIRTVLCRVGWLMQCVCVCVHGAHLLYGCMFMYMYTCVCVCVFGCDAKLWFYCLIPF